MERRQHAHALTAPLQSWTPSSNLDRSLAITDKDGRAVGRTREPGPNEIRQFYGQKSGLAGPYSGYLGQSSFEGLHHKGGTVSRPLKLELAPVEQQTLRLDGAPSELQLHAYLRGQWHCSDGDDFRMAEAATMSRPQLVSEGIATASVFSTTAPTWRAIGRSGSTPGAPGVPLVVAITATTTSAATTVAWQDLNTVNIRVVDPAGEPVAFATIGGALQGMQMPIDWRCTVVANANGEATLKLGGVAGEKWTVYAASSDQHGLAQFSLTKSADVEIVVQPFIDVALQVTDWNGHAVRGAVLQLQLSNLPASELGQCAIDASSTLLLGSHTDKGGRVSCKVPAELLGQVVVRAAFLENTSSPVTLEGGMLNLRLNKPGSTKK